MSTYYNKYRPKNLKQLIGNKEIKDTIKKIFDGKSPVPQSYLFTGGSGCGKTTLARIIGRQFGATPQGIVEMNSANLTGVDNIRELTALAEYPNVVSPKASVYILDECHKLSNAAQNALLKTLEEPPAHAYFILCTTDPDKIINTIQTRLTHFHLKEPIDEELVELLMYVCGEEGLDYEDESLIEIVTKCSGSPRQALSLLQTCAGFLTDSKRVKQSVKGKGLFVSGGDGDFAVAQELVKVMEGGKWDKVCEKLKQFTKDGMTKSVEQGVISVLGARMLWRGQSYDRLANAIIELNTPTHIYGHGIFYARMRKVFVALNKRPTSSGVK